jgi:hypothetical protein
MAIDRGCEATAAKKASSREKLLSS